MIRFEDARTKIKTQGGYPSTCPTLSVDIQRFLGSGINGSVYKACRKGSNVCDLVVKFGFIRVNLDGSEADWETLNFAVREGAFQRVAFLLNIAPNVLEVVHCPDFALDISKPDQRREIAVIVMDLVQGKTVGDAMLGASPATVNNLVAQAINNIKVYTEHGFSHGDAHYANMMVRDNDQKVVMIDFGRATNLRTTRSAKEFDDAVSNELWRLGSWLFLIGEISEAMSGVPDTRRASFNPWVFDTTDTLRGVTADRRVHVLRWGFEWVQIQHRINRWTHFPLPGDHRIRSSLFRPTALDPTKVLNPDEVRRPARQLRRSTRR